MFDFPLPIPRNTYYQILGLGPDATTDDIREATNELKTKLDAEKAVIDRHLAQVRSEVPGLAEAEDELKNLQGSADASAATEIIRAERALKALEQQAVALRSDYADLRTRSQELAGKVNEINQMGLEKAETRAAYDRDHPPLELLKLVDCTRDPFLANPRALPLLRQELTQFLTAHGEVVFHPTDLTREDFVGDYTPCTLLDGP